MRIEMALQGNLHKYIQEEQMAAKRAVTAGVKEITNRIKEELRGQVTGAGLGAKLSKTWRGECFPRRGVSLSAAGVVWSKAPKLITAFNDGTLIRPSNKTYLAVPTESCPKRGRGNKRISPETYPGKLRFVRVNDRLALLISESTRKHKDGMVMFWLVPQIQLRKRLDWMSVANKWVPQLPAAILAAWPDRSE